MVVQSKMSLPKVESFDVLTPEALDVLNRFEAGETIATILYIILTLDKFPKFEKNDCVVEDVFAPNDVAIEAAMRPFLIEILDALGGVPTPKKNKPAVDVSQFRVLCNVLVGRMSFMTQGGRTIHIRCSDDNMAKNLAIADLFIKFGKAILDVVDDLIVRTPGLIDRLVEFNEGLKGHQNINPLTHLLKKHSCYFAAYVPEDINPEHGSGHITLAFTPEEREQMLPYLGTVCQFQYATEIIEWEAYAYLPTKVIFSDGTEHISHVSIHLPEGGTEYGKNHAHQATVDDSTYTWRDEVYTSLVITYMNAATNFGGLVSFDMDKTLFTNEMIQNDEGEIDFALLHDTSRVDAAYLTEFGRFVRQLGIPFQLTTSRNSKTGKEDGEFLRALNKVFPSCVAYSSGKSLGRIDGEMRSRKKAEDKHSRLPHCILHFDDEECVLEVHGFGGHIVDGRLPIHYHKGALTGTHTHFAVYGRVGGGKTHLIESFLETQGYQLPDTPNATKVGMQCSADAADPDQDLLPIVPFARQYPDGETVLIHDTTGNKRPKTMPCFVIASELTWTNIFGCMVSLLKRSDHPNLNGRVDVDLNAPPRPVSSFNTNDMSLTEFLNYIWFTRGSNPTAFTNCLARLGQTSNFTSYNTPDHGTITFVITSYREGMQKWCKWGRQNRKAVHVFFEGRWQIVKLGLEAGQENKPVTHTDEGDSYKNTASQIQNWVCKCLFTGETLPEGTAISFKRDGALIQTTLVQGPPQFVEALYQATMASDNPFARLLAYHSYKKSDGKTFIIISTNGTLFAAVHMWDYIVTAVGSKLDLDSTELLDMATRPVRKFHLPALDGLVGYSSVINAWSNLIGEFYSSENSMWNTLVTDGHIPDDVTVTHAVEAGCPWRRTYTGVVHTELAMGYPYGFMSSLGFRWNDIYLPHFRVEKRVHDAGYDQPRFWLENDSRKIMAKLRDLQRVSMEEDYTAENFFADHPPDNKYASLASDNYMMDHEGFVLLVKTSQTKEYDYGKLKTLLYYIFHKIRESNMDLLVALSMALDLPHFPIAQFIRDSYKTMEQIDLSKMWNNVYTTMVQFAPPQPKPDADRKTAGAYRAYWQKLNAVPDDDTLASRELASLGQFLFSQESQRTGKSKNTGPPGEMTLAVHNIVLRHVDMAYLAEHYRPLVGRRVTNDKDKVQQKMIQTHMDIIKKMLTSPLSDETVATLRNHLIQVRINLPKP